MLAENPYQSPVVDCPPTRVMVESYEYPPDKCPCCATKVTLWGLFKPNIPLRYTCSYCREAYYTSVPWLTFTVVAPGVIFGLLAGGCIFGLFITSDIRFLLATIAALILSIAAEVMTDRYFLKRGKLVTYRRYEWSDPASKN